MTLALVLLLATTPAEADRLFALGTSLVAEGDTAGAVAAWQAAQATGWTSAAVEHNLGTVALARGDVGQARLHLERAARLAPLDADVARNVDLARVRSGTSPPSFARRAWTRAVAILNPLGLVALALALAFGALGLGLSGRRSWALGIGAAAVVGVAAASVAVWEATATPGVAVVEATVVEAPSPTASTLARLDAGAVLSVGEARDGWRQVRVGRQRGWVRAESVVPI